MTVAFYRLPSDIRVRVEAQSTPSLLSRVLGEEAPEEGDPDIVLNLASRKDVNARALVSSDSNDRSLTVRGTYKSIPWSCRIASRDPGGWRIDFWSFALREYLALHMALLPCARRLLVERGVALVSGAAFEMEGSASLLAGFTGRGKTTLLLSALERGGRLIGDEYLGLSEELGVVAVVKGLALRRATFAHAPKTLRRLSWARSSELRAAEFANRVTRGRLNPLVHVSPDELGVAATSDAVPVRRLFWIESDVRAGAGVRRESMSFTEAVSRLAMMNAAHDLLYGDLGAFLDGLRDDCAGTDYSSRWRETAERALAGVSCYRLTLPAGGAASPDLIGAVLNLD